MANKRKETPAQKGKRLEKEFAHRLVEELDQFQVEDYKLNPQLPRVLIQPSLLIVPRLGKLIAVEIAYIHPKKRLWDFSLERIEQLFELKLALSEGTVVTLVIIQDMDVFDDQEQERIHRWNYHYDETLQLTDAIQLLGHFYDNVQVIPLRNSEFDLNFRQFTHELLEVTSRQNLQYLWDIERESRERNAHVIYDRHGTLDILEETTQPETRYQPISHNLKDLRERCFERLENRNLFPGYRMSKRPRVFNIKQFLLNSGTSYYFTFDYLIFPKYQYYQRGGYINRDKLMEINEEGGAFIEVLRGSQKEYGQIRRLQRITTHARFISYTPDSESGRIRLLDHPPNLFLVLDGTLLGPSYDPKRYLHLLISSGWTPIYLQDLSEQALNLG